MNNYMYKTTTPAVIAAVIAWEAKRNGLSEVPTTS